jgi:uncharacterized protein YlxW (UPF0749 family)
MKKTLNDYLNALPPDSLERVNARVAEIQAEEKTLQELRKALAQSQQVIAKRMRVKQAEISKMERRTDMLISTLTGFVQAMGGTLEITAKFPNSNPVKITQFRALHEGAKQRAKVGTKTTHKD